MIYGAASDPRARTSPRFVAASHPPSWKGSRSSHPISCRRCAAATSSSSPRSIGSTARACASPTDPRSGSTGSSTQPATGSASPTCPRRSCRPRVAVCRCTGRIVPPELPGLYFAGFVDAPGGLLPVVEDQGEWIAAVLTGRLRLPTPERMSRATERVEQRTRRRFPDESPRSTRCDPHAYRRLLRDDLRRERRATRREIDELPFRHDRTSSRVYQV